jgi:hypothetical protein
MGNNLPGPEKGRLKIKHAQWCCQVHPKNLGEYHRKQPHGYVDYYKVLGYRGCAAKSSACKSVHILFFKMGIKGLQVDDLHDQ